MSTWSRWTRAGALLATALIAAQRVAVAQTATPQRPAGDLFQPLLADPKEPRFFATYLYERSPHLASRLGSVGFGQTLDLWRGSVWQVAIAAGVFSQFNMRSRTTDLMNTDYLVGLPLMYRHGTVVARFRLYHQSSHLGDEYMLHARAQRVDLTYEAAELLVSEEISSWRVYAGGEYIFTHSPAELRPGVLHGGLEYHAPGVLVRLGHLATGHLVAALDGKSLQDRDWEVGWSLVTALELGDPVTEESSWRWSLLLTAFTGPSPYGEFYRDHVRSVGMGIGLTL